MLDALYEGGVGEDYLASLVRSSAENATQTAQLKQSLVTELSELLRDLNAQQIKQSEVVGNLLSAKIQEHIDASEHHGERFRAELKDGLADIGKTVAGVAGGQGETVTGMLEHLIHTFSANIQSTFGDQMKGQAEMMNTAVTSMAEMQTGFKTLLQDLRESGKLEREDLTTKVTSLVGMLEAQQGKLESQMTAFIEAIQAQIGASQQETMAQVKESLQEIQGSVGKILTDMEKERRATVDTERDLHRQFTDTSKQLVLDMDSHISKLVEEIGKTVVALNENVTALGNTSLAAIKGMDEGAARISLAADHFAKAGNVVSGVMQQAETVSSQLSGSAGSLAQASKALESQLSQYAVTRDALARMVAEMNVMLERAKQEAGVNQQIVEDMRRMVASFGVLKDDMDEFVGSISKLLAETMTKFRHDMGTHNAEFHKHHADTLNQVASAYEPLAASIGGLTEMMSKTRKN